MYKLKLRKTGSLQNNTRANITFVFLIVEILFFSLVTPSFFSVSNLYAVLFNSMEMAVIAIGMTMLIILGGIDMSVGAAMGVVAIIVGWLSTLHMSPIVIVLVAIFVGMILGSINASLIIYGKIPDLIATIGTMYILRASIFAMLNGKWLTGLPDVLGKISSGVFLGVPILLIILLVVYALFSAFMKYSSFGRSIYAIGSNAHASYLIGINVAKVKIITYIITGGLTGIAAVLYVGRLGSAEITIGSELHIQVIAATVIGGASVLGGVGSLRGTLAGVLFMSVLRNGINVMGIPSLWERVIIGLLIVISVTVDVIIHKKQKERS